MAKSQNKVGRKKVNRYTESQCDQVINRLIDEKQENSKYAAEVACRRRKLVKDTLDKASKSSA